MTEKVFNPRKPDYKDYSGNIAVWVDHDKNKELILKVKVFNGKAFICRKPKQDALEELADGANNPGGNEVLSRT